MEDHQNVGGQLSLQWRAGMLVLLLLFVAAIANSTFELGLLGRYDRIAVAGMCVAIFLILMRMIKASRESRPFKPTAQFMRRMVFVVALVIAGLWFFGLGPYYLKGQPIPQGKLFILGLTTVVIMFSTFRSLRSLKKLGE
jgi:hypothetical protein